MRAREKLIGDPVIGCGPMVHRRRGGRRNPLMGFLIFGFFGGGPIPGA